MVESQLPALCHVSLAVPPGSAGAPHGLVGSFPGAGPIRSRRGTRRRQWAPQETTCLPPSLKGWGRTKSVHSALASAESRRAQNLDSPLRPQPFDPYPKGGGHNSVPESLPFFQKVRCAPPPSGSGHGRWPQSSRGGTQQSLRSMGRAATWTASASATWTAPPSCMEQVEWGSHRGSSARAAATRTSQLGLDYPSRTTFGGSALDPVSAQRKFCAASSTSQNPQGGGQPPRGSTHVTRALPLAAVGEIVATAAAAAATSSGASSAVTPHLGHLAISAAAVTQLSLTAVAVAYGAYLSDELMRHQNEIKQPDPIVFHDVDVTDYEIFKLPDVQRAIEYAAQAHAGQVRKTGDPYVNHCVHTARIAAGLAPGKGKMAEETVIAALLHDVVDDTGHTLKDVEREFGAEVARLVDGVSRLSYINQLLRRHRRTRAEAQEQENTGLSPEDVDSLRMMLIGMINDPRVVLVKLADRLHNMRTIYALPEDKARAVAQETLSIWCSLASRLGVWAIKAELEDLCFAVLQPHIFRKIRGELATMWSSPEDWRYLRRIMRLRRYSNLFASSSDASGGITADGTESSPGAKDGRGKSSSSSSSALLSAAADMVRDFSPFGVARGKNQEQGAPSARMGPAAGDVNSGEVYSVQELVESVVPFHVLLNKTYRNGGSMWTPGATQKPSSKGNPSAAVNPGEGAEKTTVEQSGGQRSGPGILRNVYGIPSLPRLREPGERLEAPMDGAPLNSGAMGRKSRVVMDSEVALGALRKCEEELQRELLLTTPYVPGMEISLSGRLKSIYSCHAKMRRKGVNLDKIYDARALRVVVGDGGGKFQEAAVEACYNLLSVVHRLWTPIGGEFDDYILNPKPSGYQSLHTAVVGPDGAPLEVQIRTQSMHEAAEFGHAAHWLYKESDVASSSTGAAPSSGVARVNEAADIGDVTPLEAERVGVRESTPTLSRKGEGALKSGEPVAASVPESRSQQGTSAAISETSAADVAVSLEAMRLKVGEVSPTSPAAEEEGSKNLPGSWQRDASPGISDLDQTSSRGEACGASGPEGRSQDMVLISEQQHGGLPPSGMLSGAQPGKEPDERGTRPAEAPPSEEAACSPAVFPDDDGSGDESPWGEGRVPQQGEPPTMEPDVFWFHSNLRQDPYRVLRPYLEERTFTVEEHSEERSDAAPDAALQQKDASYPEDRSGIDTENGQEVPAAGSSGARGVPERRLEQFPVPGGSGRKVMEGHPALRVSDGRLMSSVVVKVEAGGNMLLVAVSFALRARQAVAVPAQPPRSRVASKQLQEKWAKWEGYARLFDKVDTLWWNAPGHGDWSTCLERYTLCSDGIYHKIDRFGRVQPTFIQLLDMSPQDVEGYQLVYSSIRAGLQQEVDSESDDEPSMLERGRPDGGYTSLNDGYGSESFAALDAPPSGGESGEGDSTARAEQGSPSDIAAKVNNKVRLLRSMLQWERELRHEAAPDGTVSALEGEEEGSDNSSGALSEVLVVRWPGGEIVRLPSGSCAEVFLREWGGEEIPGHGQEEGSQASILVNGRPSNPTLLLKDGDLVEVRKTVDFVSQ